MLDHDQFDYEEDDKRKQEVVHKEQERSFIWESSRSMNSKSNCHLTAFDVVSLET